MQNEQSNTAGSSAVECADWPTAASLSLASRRICAADLGMLACRLPRCRGNYVERGCAYVECGNCAQRGSAGADVIVASATNLSDTGANTKDPISHFNRRTHSTSTTQVKRRLS